MTEPQKMDRTWLCSVLFTDIVGYSAQSVDAQIKLKTRFNGYLAEAIRDVPEGERVILDTGDGAAVCFLGAPELAMFAALHLLQSFMDDARTQEQPLRVRTGINLGPVKLVKDINGALNAIGDGINAGQRIMSFATENQILVSRAFYDVVSRVSDDYKKLFRLKGVETDKHVRKHTVYTLSPPGAEPPPPAPAARPAAPPAAAPPRKFTARRIALAALALVLLISAGKHMGAWRQAHPHEAHPGDSRSAEAQSAYDDGMRLLGEKKAAEAAPKFDAALKLDAKDVQSYLGRAEARRLLGQHQASVDDCNRAQKLSPEEFRVYQCRGLSEAQLKQTDAAVSDFGEAIRLNPKFGPAYQGRGNANIDQQQYGRALDDFNHAIELMPTAAFLHLRRALVYQNLQQYQDAIKDYNQAILMEPANVNAYNARANAEHLAGDEKSADADRRKAQQLRESQAPAQPPATPPAQPPAQPKPH